jgi:hypothetical protein
MQNVHYCALKVLCLFSFPSYSRKPSLFGLVDYQSHWAWVLVSTISRLIDMQNWLTGYLANWLPGFLAIWLSGYLAFWPFVTIYLATWLPWLPLAISGHLATWLSSSLTILASGYLWLYSIWLLGYLWSFLAIWLPGYLTIWLSLALWGSSSLAYGLIVLLEINLICNSSDCLINQC